MLDRDKLTSEAAQSKSDARKIFEDAVNALIALAYRYKDLGADFWWGADAELDAEANRILRGMSDNAIKAAKARALEVMEYSLDYFDEDTAYDYAASAFGGDVVSSLDMQGSHLKEMLMIWIGIAFVKGWGETELRINVMRYVGNPYANHIWRVLPANLLAWGKGYDRNIINGIAVLMQNYILAASRYAEWVDAKAKGADYYIRRRGSTYYCPECDSLCGYPIPIDEPFEETHSRCMCWPEYHFNE